MTEEKLIAALAGALNGSPRARALAGLAYVKYPPRELAPRRLSDGTLAVNVARWGWEYKHRGPKPKVVVPIDPVAVREALAPIMPEGVTIHKVVDCGHFISLIFEITKEET